MTSSLRCIDEVQSSLSPQKLLLSRDCCCVELKSMTILKLEAQLSSRVCGCQVGCVAVKLITWLKLLMWISGLWFDCPARFCYSQAGGIAVKLITVKLGWQYVGCQAVGSIAIGCQAVGSKAIGCQAVGVGCCLSSCCLSSFHLSSCWLSSCWLSRCWLVTRGQQT